ncbi:MAG: hypothetical protein Q8K65_10705 [Alphaproteobacteria bacterium]|nr:hypothetical protein [Alphaproteobacteria bacterium]
MKENSQAFNYPAAAMGICRDFPEVATDLYFFDTARKAYVPSHPVAARRLDTIAQAQENFSRQLAEFMQKLHGDKSSCVLAGTQNDHFIFLYNGPQNGGLLPHAPHEQRMHFILDHEIGHIVTSTGKPDKTKSATLHEATADVFASLRHIQRFGRKTGAIEDLLLQRAQRLVSLHGPRHPEHFSSFALEKLLEKLPATDVEYLTPRQTAALASRIAGEHTPADFIVQKLSKAFIPFKDMLAAGTGGDDPYRVLAAIVLGGTDKDIFKWGAPVLRGYIDGRLGDMRVGKEYIRVNTAPFDGSYWNAVRRQITEKEFTANRDNMTRTNPAETPPAPAAKISPSPSGQNG